MESQIDQVTLIDSERVQLRKSKLKSNLREQSHEWSFFPESGGVGITYEAKELLPNLRRSKIHFTQPTILTPRLSQTQN
jgi:hypothetical protein